MERFTFEAASAFTPKSELLQGVTIAPLTPSISRGATVQAAVFRLAPGGRIVRHPATFPQILAVIEGSGRVSGADGVFAPIAAGEVVFWPEGEEHETESADGMTAVIIEAEGLQPEV